MSTVPALAAPAAPPPGQSHREPGYGPERNQVAATDAPPQLRAATAGENKPRGDRGGYPRQTDLRTYPADPADKSIKLGLSPYHALAPKLNELQQRSNRLSVEVAGQSGLGRDLYLVTLTAPENAAQSKIQELWRDKIENDPGRAARDEALRAGYKTPVWINNNIHGNEWEGTDGALRVIEYLATTNDKAALDLLKRSRIYLNLTANPDGRVAGTRANASGFDMNRDFVTASQPETRAMREIVMGKQPVMMLDEHGYVENTLIEPTTPPHGQNYDFDLYIKHGYENGLAMEKAVQALGHPEAAKPEIPFRDYEPGVWDGWAPIYTAQYSMYHGAVSYTIEIPQRVNNDAYNLPAEELQRRSKINTDVVEATIRTTIDYADAHRTELIDNQIEIFRRGLAGEPQRQLPDGFVPGFGPEDRYTTEFPRAYVLPAGAGQRSAPATARLVDHLVANDVRVQRAEADFQLAGKSYPAGSYIVDMHQPKRALANVMLETGADISSKVEVMYDISGWSHRLLWGASVDISKAEAPNVRTTPVTIAAPTGGVDAAPGQDLALAVTDGKDVLAVNTLLGQGRPVHQQADGTVVVPASERVAVLEVAKNLGVRFTAAAAGERGPLMRKPVIAGAVAADELLVLRELGFEVRPVSTQVLNNGFDLSRVDALFVSSGLSYRGLNAAAKNSVKRLFQRGGVITRGATGAAFNTDAGLLPVTAVTGREDANGVVSVTNGTGPIGSGAPESSFVYSPLWFTGLGAGVTAEQRYAEQNPLAAGHWLPNDDGQGPAQAAGAASVVSGVDESGAKTVLFGTEPLFRAHPKGLYAQVGKAVFWATTR